MTFHFGSDAPKLLLQFCGFRCPEFVGNRVAQPVFVDSVQFRSKQHLLLLQPQHRCSDELLLVRLALAEHRCQLAGELGRDPNLLENLTELANQFFLANVRVSARSPVTCAVVVDVQDLLRFGSECTTASTAGDQSGERVPPLRVLGMIGGCKHVLNASEEVARDDRFVQSLM
ncbi:MAG TPA: hypothetical protein VHJ58_05290 [Vicinamibacterales bacterium]|nr:hypothetical protein [Vicinamibacterales bacterium]